MKIEMIMLQVERGEEEIVTFPEGTDALFLASVLKSLTDHGYILSGVDFTDEDKKEE